MDVTALVRMLLWEGSSFAELPDAMPYGFWITPEQDVVPVLRMGGHDQAARTELGRRHRGLTLGADAVGSARRLRWVDLVAGPERLMLRRPPDGHVPPATMRTARDLAAFYRVPLLVCESRRRFLGRRERRPPHPRH